MPLFLRNITFKKKKKETSHLSVKEPHVYSFLLNESKNLLINRGSDMFRGITCFVTFL